MNYTLLIPCRIYVTPFIQYRLGNQGDRWKLITILRKGRLYGFKDEDDYLIMKIILGNL